MNQITFGRGLFQFMNPLIREAIGSGSSVKHWMPLDVGHPPRPASTQSRDRSLSPPSARPADPPTGLIVSHQGWDMTQAFPAVVAAAHGIGRHAGQRSCGGRLSRQDPTMCRIIAVGRIVLYPEPTGIRLGMCGQGAMTSWVHHPMPSSGAGGGTVGHLE